MVVDISPKKLAKDSQSGKTWGRDRDIGYPTILACASLFAICPFAIIYFWSACNSYKCSLGAPIDVLLSIPFTWKNFFGWVYDLLPTPTYYGFVVYFSWVALQAFLNVVVQGPIGTGQLTPAGHLLKYNVNGFRCWVITHVLYVVFGYFIPIIPLSIVHDNWGGILVAANVLGYFMTFFSYFKAHYFPSHAGDRKFSGSRLYDLFMGIEFNPRLGEWFDFKLFFNGRPGIVAWTLIDLSFAAAQYNQLGYVTNSMILLNVLHAIYVVDYFWNEDWYLRTIDIAHDHFGFYLAWGDCVLLPYMYTLQSHYLVRNPIDMSTPYFLFVTALGLTGYYIFRTVNNQKDLVRKEDGKCLIWGKPARIIRASYITSDGKKHTSVLLTSGYWGISRHFNYLGDLMLSLAMCMTCGFDHWLPYFYIVWMTCLLGHRVERDSKRCHGKYGEYWDQYCKLVPYKVIPFVY